ncbi:MAG: decaprenyl-phosphate phosphoribosyltransferase [Patescibacteria group bacterium]
MVNLSISALKIARPIHWAKNFSLFAAIFLTGTLFEKGLFIDVFWAFIAFNLATSATYIFNDILDVKLDRLHPTKKFRPLASGNLPLSLAILEGVILSFLALMVSISVNYLLFLLIGGYLIMQALYSLGLKNIPIIDILIIATGFIIRVYAGALVIDAHLSVWFLLCVISVALFLASGKRRAELNVLEETNEITRKSLVRYKQELLNSYVTMFGNASWMSWALYTFFESPKASLPVWLFLAELSRTTTVNKLLMATIPLVIFGIMRYEAVIFEGKSEAPEKVLLTDKPLLIAVTLWVSLIYWIIYSGASITNI